MHKSTGRVLHCQQVQHISPGGSLQSGHNFSRFSQCTSSLFFHQDSLHTNTLAHTHTHTHNNTPLCLLCKLSSGGFIKDAKKKKDNLRFGISFIFFSPWHISCLTTAGTRLHTEEPGPERQRSLSKLNPAWFVEFGGPERDKKLF